MSGFAALFQWLADFWDIFKEAFIWIFDSLLGVVQFIAFTIIDGLLSVLETLISAVDFSSVAFNYAAHWSALPSQLIWLIDKAGLPQCLTLLGSAYLIRLTLNLIPSWATRV